MKHSLGWHLFLVVVFTVVFTGVCHSVHGGWGGVHGRGMRGRGGVCVAGGHAWWGTGHGGGGGGGACLAGEMATAASGTHPTGMHSCYFLSLYPKKFLLHPIFFLNNG